MKRKRKSIRIYKDKTDKQGTLVRLDKCDGYIFEQNAPYDAIIWDGEEIASVEVAVKVIKGYVKVKDWEAVND